MKFTGLTLSILASAVYALPTISDLDDGNFIVTLNDDTDLDDHLSQLGGLLSGSDSVTHKYDNVFKGYAGSFSKTLFQSLSGVLDGHIANIEKDGVSYALDLESGFHPAPWGLERISQREKLPEDSDVRALNYDYNYPQPSGAGVDVYVIDTGIRISHEDFEGRASYGFWGGYPDANDDNEHGTHVAGTIGGKTYGVAKSVDLLAVKVLNGTGQGTNSDIIAGINYVVQNSKSTGKPSIASLSLGGDVSPALDKAVQLAIQTGVHFVVAAGNENKNAGDSSPARVEEAITVGASTIYDQRAEFSNYGSVVDIFAPGMNITSTSNKDDTSSLSLSGTSMATPHVSGALASLLSQVGQMSPADASQKLKDIATKGVLGNVEPPCGLFCLAKKSFRRQSGVSNNLLYNNV
ncbi:hypothetical protein E3Q23_04117 [Wallemia mellicola]|uniref:Peptidase S8/S53 domain-containing protein n=1 Tax=Wallemia mellicola TaxID=1708541 RepID=A0A4T0T9X6_9BASI|nr:hypothetical protein E3Q23_04117 [Wallemia mellicola]TIC09293.1 hypothetical protein E3Q14_03440 [Wallemia mellicola]TIC28170.1 hypothetical protein E3Q10_03334 [Wallemia mellicola]TIC62104.1 hypothetical protein E3Q01_04135 [Wallemia mellicola]